LNIFKDVEFTKSRDVLLARKRQLVEVHAKGNRPQARRALTEEEEELLFDKGLFGDHEPETLQRTVDVVFTFWLQSTRRVQEIKVGRC
jgi:uncharacterized protein YaeQ